MSYVYMKVLETAPERYDRGMRLLTLGRWQRAHRDMAARLEAGQQVLDLGCGTGALVVALARKGAQVTGVDISPPMLSLAAMRVRDEGLEDRVTLRELGAVDVDTTFDDEAFDAITSSLMFSELSDAEIEYTLAECHRILRPGGRLLIADEVLPESTLGKIGTYLLRLPFALLAFLLTQNSTHRVAGLEMKIGQAGFRMLEVQSYLAGTFKLFVAEKG